jgi:hypothetical protein
MIVGQDGSRGPLRVTRPLSGVASVHDDAELLPDLPDDC